jgi:chemotaxis protein CheC
MGIEQLSDMQRDALKEMANIGSGHAATAMSHLLRRNVIIRVPRVMSGILHDIVSNFYTNPTRIAAVLLNFSGDIAGKALLAFRQKEVDDFPGMMLPSSSGLDPEIFDSLVKEIANIVFCSYLNALGSLLNFTIIPSVPTIAAKLDYELTTNAAFPWLCSDEMIFGIETEFFFTQEKKLFRSLLFIVPDPKSLDSILQALKVAE